MDSVNQAISLGKRTFLFFCLLLFIANISAGILGRQWHFLFIALFNVFGGILLLRNNPYSARTGKLLLFLPFIALYIGTSVYMALENRFTLIPFLCISMASALVASYTWKMSVPRVIGLNVGFLAISALCAYFLLNYFVLVAPSPANPGNLGHSLNEFGVTLTSKDGKQIGERDLIGKISVFDVWNSRCGNCINGFPAYDEVRKKYKGNKGVQFFSLNLPLRGDERQRVTMLTQPYGFQLLFTDSTTVDKLGIHGVPCLFILDRKMNIRYMGGMYSHDAYFLDNIYDIVDELNNEKG